MKKNSINLVLVLVISLLFASKLIAQIDTTAIRFGLSGAYLFNQHRANFDTIPGIASCCRQQYGGASSQGWSVSAFVEYPVSRLTDFATMSLHGRISYFQGLGANLSALETVRIQGGNAQIRHELESQLTMLAFEPMLTVRLFKRLTASIGVQVGTFLQPSYQYRERILEPSDITYANGQTTFNASADALSAASPFQAALVGGMALELQVNRTGTILPTLEAFCVYPLTSVANSVDWRVASLRLGASLRFSPFRTTELTAEEIEQRFQDSLQRVNAIAAKALAEAKESRKKELTAKIGEMRPVFFGEEDSGSDSARSNGSGALDVRLGAENFSISVTKIPTIIRSLLVPKVYFSENSSIIPSRYRIFSSFTETIQLNSELLEKNVPTLKPQKITLNGYYQMLNIVGKRLQESPNSSFGIVGFASSKEQNPKQLANARAVSVAAYFQNVWRISSSRISIRDTVIAASVANEEWRAVEFRSNDENVLRPFEFQFEKKEVSPEGLELQLQIAAGQGLKQWDLEISQLSAREAFTLHTYQGGATYPEKYLWDIRQNPPKSSENLSLKLSIDDVSNNKFEAPIISLQVREVPTSKRREIFLIFPEAVQKIPNLAGKINAAKSGKARLLAKFPPNTEIPFSILPSDIRRQDLSSPMFDSSTPEGMAYNRTIMLEFEEVED
ncbi:MAG: hypothetical protein MUF71_07645 [Candidatus Kapabacteria bacterium]|nr:hypothetical protein [Candidatus Kapabacteria bacterium]